MSDLVKACVLFLQWRHQLTLKWGTSTSGRQLTLKYEWRSHPGLFISTCDLSCQCSVWCGRCDLMWCEWCGEMLVNSVLWLSGFGLEITWQYVIPVTYRQALVQVSSPEHVWTWGTEDFCCHCCCCRHKSWSRASKIPWLWFVFECTRTTLYI